MVTRVLLADQSTAIQSMIVRALGSERVEVVCADNGELAQKLLCEIRPDLLIAEFGLPEKTGLDLCVYAKQAPELRSMPIILLDTQLDIRNLFSARSVAADAYLAKPLDLSTLTATVRRLLKSQERESDGLSKGPLPMPAAESFSAPLKEPATQIATRPQARDVDVALEDQQQIEQSPPDLPYRITGRHGKLRRRAPLPFWAILAGLALIVAGMIVLRPARVKEPVQTLTETQSSDKGSWVATPDSAAAPVLGSVNGIGIGLNAHANTRDEAAVATRGSGAAKPEPRVGQPEGEGSAASTSADYSGQSAPTKARPSASKPGSSTGISGSQPANPSTRARRVRVVSPARSESHMRRGAREMAQAGKHLGKGGKHIGQGSADGVVWSGKKIGRGFKQVGKAFKSIF